MASTNKTTNYELSQFQSSDIPAWLTDYNGDMQKIDAGIHAAKTQAAGAASGVSALQTAVSGKQDRLAFDDAPISGSSNPVTSGGIYTALQSVSVQTDAVPTAGSTKAVQSGGVYDALAGKQNTLTFDSTPTSGSSNPVTSNGIYQALQTAGATAQYIAGGGSWEGSTGLSNFIIKLGNLIMFGGSKTDAPIKNVSGDWVTINISGINRHYSPIGTITGNPFNLESSSNITDAITNDKGIGLAQLNNLDTSVFSRGTLYFNAFFDGTQTCIYVSMTAGTVPATGSQVIMPNWAILV